MQHQRLRVTKETRGRTGEGVGRILNLHGRRFGSRFILFSSGPTAGRTG